MIKKWKRISEKVNYPGYRKVMGRTFKMPNGETKEYDIKIECNAVCVLALTENNEVILVEQFRPGLEKILLDLPGGCMDKDEKPIEAMERELAEETGYKGKLFFTGKSLEDAYSTRTRYNFIAFNCKKVEKQKLDRHEYIMVKLMNLTDFKKHLRSGDLIDVATGYLGLDYLNSKYGKTKNRHKSN